MQILTEFAAFLFIAMKLTNEFVVHYSYKVIISKFIVFYLLKENVVNLIRFLIVKLLNFTIYQFFHYFSSF